MNLVWSPQAIDDLADLHAYVASNNPTAARDVVLRILDAVELTLLESPKVGRAGRVPATREFVVPRTPYIVPYRLRGATIEILRVYHGRRRWPTHFA